MKEFDEVRFKKDRKMANDVENLAMDLFSQAYSIEETKNLLLLFLPV